MQDLTKTVDEILVDLINASNEVDLNYTPYAYDQLQFKDIESMPAGSSRNSTIKVSDMDAANESDWMSLYYNRVPLARPLARIAARLRYDGYESTHEMIDAINERFRTGLTEDDIENEDINFDPENDEYPFTVAITAKATSKVYIGAGTIDLIDPDKGLGIITQVDHSFNEGNMSIAENGEILVTGAVFKIDGDIPEADSQSGSPVYTLDLEPTENWAFSYNFELTNTINGPSVYDLYNIRMIVETNGDARFDMTLFKEGGNYIFRSQDRTLSIANNTIGDDGVFIQNFLKLSDFPDAITQESKNTAGAALGNYRFILIAERRSGEAAPVTVEFSTVTAIAPNVNATLYQTGNILQLVADAEDDYLLPFNFQVRVTGPAGIPVSLENDIVIYNSIGANLTFSTSPIVVSGITIADDAAGLIPAGLGKGVYDLNGFLKVPASFDTNTDGDSLTLSFTFENLRGEDVLCQATWTVLAVDAEPAGDFTMSFSDDAKTDTLTIEDFGREYSIPFTWTINIPTLVTKDIEMFVNANNFPGYENDPATSELHSITLGYDEPSIIPAGTEAGVYEISGEMVIPGDILADEVSIFVEFEDPNGRLIECGKIWPIIKNEGYSVTVDHSDSNVTTFTPNTIDEDHILDFSVRINLPVDVVSDLAVTLSSSSGKFVGIDPDPLTTRDDDGFEIGTRSGIIPAGTLAGAYSFDGQLTISADFNVASDGETFDLTVSFDDPDDNEVSGTATWSTDVTRDFVIFFDETEKSFGPGVSDGEGGFTRPDWYDDAIGQWSINGTTLFRDAYFAEGDDTGMEMIGADVIAGETVLGSTLVLTVTVRESDGNGGWTYSTASSAPYTVASKYWGDNTRPVINSITVPVEPAPGQTMVADFTPAVFGDFEAGDTVETYWDSFYLNDGGGGHGTSGLSPSYQDENETVFVLRQGRVPLGEYSPSEWAISEPYSVIAQDLGPTPPYLYACTERPRVLRVVEDALDEAIVYPGQWDINLTTKLTSNWPTERAFYKLPEGHEISGTDLYTSSTLAMSEDDSFVAGDLVTRWISPSMGGIELKESDNNIEVMALPSTILTTLEAASNNLPTLAAPSITSISNYNEFAFTHGQDLSLLNPLEVITQWRVYNQWSLEEPGEWVGGGYTVGEGLTLGDNLLGRLDLFDPSDMSPGQVMIVHAATIVKTGVDTFEFSDWSAPYRYANGDFMSTSDTLGGSTGSIIRISDWIGNGANLIDAAADAAGYIVVNVLNDDGSDVFTGTYTMAYATTGYGDDTDGDARCFVNNTLPAGVMGGRLKASVTFYNSSDVALGTADGYLSFDPGS